MSDPAKNQAIKETMSERIHRFCENLRNRSERKAKREL